ncbi:MAG: O-antigen ligase family protein [Breznakia sp.]
MSWIKQLLYDIKDRHTSAENIITCIAISLFLPYPITCGILVVSSLYILIKSDFKTVLKSVYGAKILLLFGVYLFIVSLCFQNYIGALASVVMLSIFVCIIHIRKYMHKQLFVKLVDIMIVLSLVSVVVSVFEQLYYVSQVDAMRGFFDIQNKPQYRVHLFYLNANYYALMVLYAVCFCVYRFMDDSDIRHRLFYVICGIANLFALFLTGGRIAWLCLAVGLLVMVFMKKWYRLFAATIVAVFASVGLLFLKPQLIPRLAQKGLALGRREKIYRSAILMLQQNYIFGRGPLTYYNQWPDYVDSYKAIYGAKGWGKLGISAPHAHSFLLEPLLSFGIVGVVMLCGYLFTQIKSLYALLKSGIDSSLMALIFGFIIVTFSFCIIDFPIYWIQTATLFLMVLGACDIYRKELSHGSN